MEKKNNKGLYVIIGILIAVALFLTGLIIVLLTHNSREDTNMADINDMVVATSNEDGKGEGGISEDIFAREVTEAEQESARGISIVIGGFKLHILSDYGCFYSDEIGPVVYMDDVFQMKTGVQDGSYEDTMKNPESLTEKTIAAGGEILQDVQEKELDGKKYAYFRMKLYDDESFVVYTQAADTDRRLAGQLIVESDGLTDEDLLNVFASIASSAEVTDEPDSSREDIDGQITSADMGEAKEESRMAFKSDTVTFRVPKGFYSQYTDQTDSYVSEEFVSEGYVFTVNCFLESNEDFANAKTYIEFEADTLQSLAKQTVEVKTEEVNGNIFYYVIAQYTNDETQYQRIYAACDISASSFYLIEANSVDEKEELTMDKIREFFLVK
ncbi:MAG: hypothetical protein NC300_05320 [Bacteroidales bacterium]|nr:hypothetical protein [Clostridium sp.]MCM1203544.1 hypothetical protein [Bacteroidales bacterium]